MITTINNDSRVFQIVRKGFFIQQYFCNLEMIPQIIREELEPNDQFIICEVWNLKLKKCSKKHLNEMFEAAKIDFKL